MQQKYNITGKIFTISLIISFLSILNNTFFSFFSSFALYVFFFTSVILIYLKGSINKKVLVYFIFTAIYLCICTIINNGGIGSIITYITAIFVIYGFSDLRISNDVRNNIGIFLIFIMIFLAIKSIQYSEDWMFHRYNSINPNIMGLFTMYAYIYASSLVKIGKKIKFMLILALILSLINYAARGVLISSIFFIVLGDLLLEKINKKMLLHLGFCIITIGIMFPILYLVLHENNMSLNLLGKPLYTGREAIWINMFNAFSRDLWSIFLGLGSHVNLWEGMPLNVHNNYYAMIVNFGVLSLILYFCFLYFIYIRIDMINHNQIKRYIIGFYSSTMLLGVIEVTTLWATIFALSFGTIALAVSENSAMKEYV